MNLQERAVIDGIFDRLKQVEHQPRDAEAERLVAERVAKQPYAPYAMAQAIFVQDEALKQFNDRVRVLEDEVRQAREMRAASPPSAGGIPGGGPSSVAPDTTRGSVPRTGTPMMPDGARPQAFGPQGQAGTMQGEPTSGGGFLRSALATAVGVAGGALLFQGLSGLFGGGEAKAAEDAGGGAMHHANAPGAPWGGGDATHEEPAAEDASPEYDIDFGGGDDWA